MTKSSYGVFLRFVQRSFSYSRHTIYKMSCGALNSVFVLVETVKNKSHHWNCAQSQQTGDDNYSKLTRWLLIWTGSKKRRRFRMRKLKKASIRKKCQCLTYCTWGVRCRCHIHEEQLTFFTPERNVRSYQRVEFKNPHQRCLPLWRVKPLSDLKLKNQILEKITLKCSYLPPDATMFKWTQTAKVLDMNPNSTGEHGKHQKQGGCQLLLENGLSFCMCVCKGSDQTGELWVDWLLIINRLASVMLAAITKLVVNRLNSD